jgi:adenylate kinase
MILVLLGPPGAGKGTQAVALAQALGHVHLSTGDLFRRSLAEGRPLGLEAEGYMKRGELVPDETVVGMVRERLSDPDTAAGVVLDGFPRTVRQAVALDALVGELVRPLPQAVEIAVEDEALIKRLTGRRVCRAAGHPYHVVYSPPRQAGLCDIDASELYQRADDTVETVTRRLAVYSQDTKPVLDYYGAAGRLWSVSGEGPPQEVAARLQAAVRAMVP